MRKLAFWLFVVFVVGIVFSTFSPIELRPRSGALAFERVLPFGLLGACLILALPRRLVGVQLAVLLIAFGSEFGQTFVPGRHSELSDAYEKSFGAVLGVLGGHVVDRLAQRLRKGRRQPKGTPPAPSEPHG